MVTLQDPVSSGLVDSLAHPGGNITGIATLQRELSGKRLELLTEIVPRISHIGVLGVVRRDSSTTAIAFQEYEIAARALKIQLQSLEVRDPNPDIEGAIQIAAQRGANALITITNPLLSRYRSESQT